MSTKTDNAHLSSKLDLRRHFLKKYPGPHNVLDCCRGEGTIWGQLRGEFDIDEYMGVDMKPMRGVLKVDSVRVLQRPEFPFNVVDIDTYGSPWKHWEALLQGLRVPTSVFLTIGMIKMAGGGNLGNVAIEALGLERIKHSIPQSLVGKLADLSVQYCVAKAWDRCQIVEAVEAFPSGNARYMGLRLVPKK